MLVMGEPEIFLYSQLYEVLVGANRDMGKIIYCFKAINTIETNRKAGLRWGGFMPTARCGPRGLHFIRTEQAESI